MVKYTQIQIIYITYRSGSMYKLSCLIIVKDQEEQI